MRVCTMAARSQTRCFSGKWRVWLKLGRWAPRRCVGPGPPGWASDGTAACGDRSVGRECADRPPRLAISPVDLPGRSGLRCGDDPASQADLAVVQHGALTRGHRPLQLGEVQAEGVGLGAGLEGT